MGSGRKRPAAGVWITGARRGARMSRILDADDRPSATLLLHAVMQRHSLRGRPAFGFEGDGHIGLIAMRFDRGNVHIHSGDIDTGALEMIEQPLADRFVARTSPVARRQNQKRQNHKRPAEKGYSHPLIIVGTRWRFPLSVMSQLN